MDILSVRNQMKRDGINFKSLPLRVAYYARVSTDFMEQLNSLENQKRFFTEYIGDMPSWEFAGGYIDEGISGVTTKKREKFNEMIDDALDGKFDMIVTKEVSRFARNTLDSIQYTRQLLANGVAVYFQNDNINTLDEDSEFRLTIMASIAQDESRKISSRVHWGHQQAIKNGVVLGNSNIFGYRKADKRLYIDEEQAPVVRELFELYATGKYSMKNLETYFYNKGVRNTKGNKLAHSTMANIIKNPKYMGYYVGNKVRVVDLFTKKQQFLPEEEWVIYKDETGETVPPIVSEELWQRANEVLKMRSLDVKQKQNKTNHNNLLTGKLICAHCGKPYYRKDTVSKKGTVNSAWRCAYKINHGKDSCPSMTIYEHEIIPILEEVFKSSQSNIQELSDLILKLSEEILNTNEGVNRIEALNKDIDIEQRKKQKLLKLNIEGLFPDCEFIRMTAECDDEIKRCQEEIEVITDQLSGRKDINKELAEIRSILTLAAESLDTDELDRSFVDRFIKQILVYPGEHGMRLEIELNAGDKVVKALLKNVSRTGQTSKEIVEDCGINRNSFYYHFDDIPSLMEEIFNEQADEFVSRSFSPDNLYDSIMTAIAFSLENKTAILHVFNSPNRQYYDRYLNRVARRTVMEFFNNYTKDSGNIKEEDREAFVMYYKSLLVGFVLDWIYDGVQYDLTLKIKRICELFDGTLELAIERCTEE